MNKVISAVLIVIIIVLGCNKDKEDNPNPANTGYKIEIIRGDKQADTLGEMLTDSIIVKATKDGKLLKKASVLFETSGCDRNLSTEQTVMGWSGETGYRWRLNGIVGKQTLKIVLLDSLRARVDSVTAEATGIKPAHGWYRSSCTPELGKPTVNSFCRLSSGRLIAAFNTFDYPYYSDDNAVTWHPLTTFPLGSDLLFIIKLIATSSDEIFAATLNNGLYYSPDGGLTWSLRSAGITDLRSFTDMAYTGSGKLIYTTYIGGVYLSEDKGLSWTSLSVNTTSSDRYYYPTETADGVLYLVGDAGNMYRSADGGHQWSKSLGASNVRAMYVDRNGYIYQSITSNYAELHRSVDNGATWSLIYTAPAIPGVYPEIHKMRQENNGRFYFYYYGGGLISTEDFNTFTSINPALTEQSRTYITDRNGNIIIGTAFDGIYYNLP